MHYEGRGGKLLLSMLSDVVSQAKDGVDAAIKAGKEGYHMLVLQGRSGIAYVMVQSRDALSFVGSYLQPQAESIVHLSSDLFSTWSVKLHSMQKQLFHQSNYSSVSYAGMAAGAFFVSMPVVRFLINKFLQKSAVANRILYSRELGASHHGYKIDNLQSGDLVMAAVSPVEAVEIYAASERLKVTSAFLNLGFDRSSIFQELLQRNPRVFVYDFQVLPPSAAIKLARDVKKAGLRCELVAVVRSDSERKKATEKANSLLYDEWMRTGAMNSADESTPHKIDGREAKVKLGAQQVADPVRTFMQDMDTFGKAVVKAFNSPSQKS
eukprot:489390-Hanusia_phi.AAC.2